MHDNASMHDAHEALEKAGQLVHAAEPVAFL